MPSTFSLISKVTNATSSVSFSGIPQGYADLCLIAMSRYADSSQKNLWIRINGDSTTAYYYLRVTATGSSVSTVSSGNGASSIIIPAAVVPNTSDQSARSRSTVNFYDYANNDKKLISFDTAQIDINGGDQSFGTALYSSSSPITSISIVDIANQTSSDYYLYGILA